MTLERLPPHDVTAEEAVVAALLLDEDAVLRVIGEGLQPADFFREQHRWAYEAAIALSERGEPITIPTLAHELDRANHLDAIGGEATLFEIVSRHFTAQGVEAHARLVARDAMYRRMIQAAGQIAVIGYAGGPKPDEAIGQAEALLRSVAAGNVNGGAHHISEVVESGDSDDRRLVTTGYAALDRVIRGIGMGEVMTIGARTNHGKTALGVGMAYRQALQGVPIGYMPIEGNAKMIAHRMAATTAKISLGYGEQMGWAPGEREYYDSCYRELGQLPIFMPLPKDTPRTVAGICSWITRTARHDGIKVAYLDHIDHLVMEPARGQSTAGAYSDAMKRIAEVAGREQIGIVVLSQVNREVRKSEEIVPEMWMMRESGAKEEDSQTILMVGVTDDDHNTLHPDRGKWMHVKVAKLKDYAGSGWITAPESMAPVLWLDDRSGAVRELGEQY